MIGIDTLVATIFYLVVVGVIFFLLNWLVDYVALPAPFARVAKVLLAVCAVFIVIGVLLGLVGHPLVRW